MTPARKTKKKPRNTEAAVTGEPQRPRCSARETALALVGRRMLSVAELSARLEHKRFSREEVADAVAMVLSYGYVNDDELGRAVCREAARTGRGPAWVMTTLLRRGVSEERARAAAEASAAEEPDLLRAVATRRFGDPTRLEPADRQRAWRFLLGRGFSHEQVARLLSADF